MQDTNITLNIWMGPFTLNYCFNTCIISYNDPLKAQYELSATIGSFNQNKLKTKDVWRSEKVLEVHCETTTITNENWPNVNQVER